jgi:short-subunit dehydrogenase
MLKRVLLFAVPALILVYILRRLAPFHSFKGKVVVITGGSRGLGLALARRLAREGAILALLARNEAELARAKANLAEYQPGSVVVVFPCDARNESELSSTIAQIGQHLGQIDALINNAGEIVVGPLVAMNREDFERALQLHCLAPLTAVLAAQPYLRQSSVGMIINIASFGGRVAVPHLAPYCVSKFALVGLSEGLHAELARENISVTTVAPGLMRTGSHKNALFKGNHRKEFTWFSLGAANPVISMRADHAARLILNAARRRRANLTITFPAHVMVVAHALFPNLVAGVLAVIARLLPKMPAAGGQATRSGWESESQLSPSGFTAAADRATTEFNEE